MTYTYKNVKDLDGNVGNTFLRKEDNASIPFDPDNRDYQDYLAWVAEGNTPDSAD